MENSTKKSTNKKWIGVGAVAVICAGIILSGKFLGKEAETSVVDSEGTEIAKLVWKDGGIHYECETGYEDYVDLACQEAISALSKAENLKKSKAGEKLVKEQYVIKTAFESNAFEALKKGSSQISVTDKDSMAMALSDGKGNLIAAYTESSDESVNRLLDRTYAGSTIKPLSTYGPAIEDDAVTWSTLYADSPFEETKDDAGNTEPWPANVEEFTNQKETVAQALCESNNAITVKILNDYGLDKSCTYLEDILGMDVTAEKKLIEKDEDGYRKELLSSLGMGYLDKGVTIKEMLEDYQAFSQSGTRYELTALKSLEDKDGNLVYEKEEKTDQIFSEDTAYIMNRMLRGVVEDGTAKSAQIDGVDVCGKTGTSENYRDNWFIGMTPEYTCAVWYSSNDGERIQNASLLAFRDAIEELSPDQSSAYPVSDDVVEKEYCEKTGLLAGKNCQSVKRGYYKKDELPETCTE